MVTFSNYHAWAFAGAIVAALYLYTRRTLQEAVRPDPVNNTVVLTRPSKAAPPATGRRDVAIVLGWGGAKRAHLRRLLEHYADVGVATVSYISSMSRFLQVGLAPADVVEILQVLDDYLREGALPAPAAAAPAGAPLRLFFHLHSNNSLFIYTALLHTLRLAAAGECKELARYAHLYRALTRGGIICDSSPLLPGLRGLDLPSDFHAAIAHVPPHGPYSDSHADPHHPGHHHGRHHSQLPAAGQSSGPILPSAALQAVRQTPVAFRRHSGLLYELIAVGGFTFPIVSIILRRNQYAHAFWTPATYLVMAAELLAHRAGLAARRIAAAATGNKAWIVEDALGPYARAPRVAGDYAEEGKDVNPYPASDASSAACAPAVASSAESAALLARSPLVKAGQSEAPPSPASPTPSRSPLHVKVSFDEMAASLVEDPAPCAHLFILSEKDTLIRNRDVLRFAYALHCRGMTVQCVDFNSPHVSHFLKHPALYKAALAQFFAHTPAPTLAQALLLGKQWAGPGAGPPSGAGGGGGLGLASPSPGSRSFRDMECGLALDPSGYRGSLFHSCRCSFPRLRQVSGSSQDEDLDGFQRQGRRGRTYAATRVASSTAAAAAAPAADPLSDNRFVALAHSLSWLSDQSPPAAPFDGDCEGFSLSASRFGDDAEGDASQRAPVTATRNKAWILGDALGPKPAPPGGRAQVEALIRRRHRE